MNWLARLYGFYLIPAILGLLACAGILLLESFITSKEQIFKEFLFVALLPVLYYLQLYFTARFGMVGLFQRLLEMLPARQPRDPAHLSLRDELAEIARENVAHTFAALCVIGSIFGVHKSLELILGHNAMLFDRIPIRYIFDLGHLVVLAKLVFTLAFLQRVKREWAGLNCPTSELLNALHDENPKVRRKAAQLLGEWQHAEAAHVIMGLTGALDDHDRAVRRYAVASLRQISDRKDSEYNKHAT